MIGIHELTLPDLKKILEETREQADSLFPEAGRLKAETLQDRLARLPSDVYERLRAAGEQMLETPIPQLPFSVFLRFGGGGDRKQYEDRYFERRKRLSILSMLHLVDGGDRWIPALEDVIWAICEESTWVIPAHTGLNDGDYPNVWDRPQPPQEPIDLFAGETSFALAELIALFGERLHPWVTDRVKKEIKRRMIDAFFCDPVPQIWEMKTNNWPAVCASCLGGTAIYLETDSGKLAGMLWRVLQSLKAHLSGFDADGATPEGLAYWQFGFGYYVYFSELLKERTGGRIDLLSGEKIGRIIRFPEACLLSGNRVVNFSDSPDEVELSFGLFARLREVAPELAVPQGEPAIDGFTRCWNMFSRALLWQLFAKAPPDGAEASLPETRRNRDYYFPGHQWVISKRYGEEGLAAFAAKGGFNEEPHNHNDLGHFILHCGGTNVLMDLGAGFYTGRGSVF